MTPWKPGPVSAALPTRAVALALAAALISAGPIGCATSGSSDGYIVSEKPAPPPTAPAAPAPAGPPTPKHKTFHYKTDSVPGVLGQWGQGTLDPAAADNFANGGKYECPGAGTLRVESAVEPDGTQLRVAVYTSGGTPLAVTSKGEPLDAKIEQGGPCFVVVSVPNFSWEATFRIKATFTPEKLRP